MLIKIVANSKIEVNNVKPILHFLTTALDSDARNSVSRTVLGIFIERLNPRAKALGPNQNKNAQIQLVKLSKQKVFVKLKNLFEGKMTRPNFFIG
jgi:hypothetical protein